MSTQETHTDDTLAGDAQLTSADGGAAVSPDTLTLAEVNSLLGKDFKDKDTALKAIKDTQSYVGKRKEDIAAELAASQAAPQDSTQKLEAEFKKLKDDLFFSQNPQFNDYRSLFEKIGGDPAEVAELPEFKTVLEKAKAADEADQNKSVVHSSPRLAESKSVIDEAVQVANARSSTNEDVATVFAKSLIENGQA